MNYEKELNEAIDNFDNASFNYIVENNHIIQINVIQNKTLSTIRVIEDRDLFKIVCVGNYKAYVFGGNWHKWYLEMIDTFNPMYNADKLESGKALKWDYNQFATDMIKYLLDWRNGIQGNNTDDWFKENYGDEYEMLFDEINDFDKYDEFRYIQILDTIEDILGDYEIYSHHYGYILEDDFIAWMAIIKIVQDSFKETHISGGSEYCFSFTYKKGE